MADSGEAALFLIRDLSLIFDFTTWFGNRGSLHGYFYAGRARRAPWELLE